jgi:hypothetical protein
MFDTINIKKNKVDYNITNVEVNIKYNDKSANVLSFTTIIEKGQSGGFRESDFTGTQTTILNETTGDKIKVPTRFLVDLVGKLEEYKTL